MNLNALLTLGALTVLTLTACSPTEQYPKITISDSHDAIVGGYDIDPGHPLEKSVVAVYDAFEGQICTGSLLPNNLVLTAAHCVGLFTEEMYVFFGTELNSKTERRKVDRIEISPLWESRKNFDYNNGDIAILHMTAAPPAGYKPVQFLNHKIKLMNGAMVVLAGYGMSNGKTGDGIGRLRATTAFIENINFSFSEFTIDQTKGTGACHGDSGGPAYVKINKDFYLLGITSRAIDDEDNDCSRFTAYTSTAFYRSWIKRASEKLTQPLVALNLSITR